MAERILIVEDEEKLAGLLRDYLAQEGYEASVLHRGDEVEDWVRSHPTDLVLLDLMLPGKSGLEVCKALRASTDVSIIMVTARIDEVDRLLGLAIAHAIVQAHGGALAAHASALGGLRIELSFPAFHG